MCSTPAEATTVHRPLRVAVDLRPSPMVYNAGFNGNGLVVTDNGRYVLLADHNDHTFHRIDLHTHQVVPIDLGGAKGVSSGGLLLRGNTLTAVTELDNPDGRIAVLKPYIDDFACTGRGDTLLAARDDDQVDLVRPSRTWFPTCFSPASTAERSRYFSESRGRH
ncbi:MAG: hypothetical protein HOY76_27245 [Streptomyces sp.]|nr:hypothetical protein [Streptomyces sp.]